MPVHLNENDEPHQSTASQRFDVPMDENKVLPQYPVVANSPRLAGAVRLEVLVSTSGKVKTVEIRGGHPLLAQAAAAAISQWKWEPANHESRETVEVKFVPPPL
jgi:TonB family protein